MDSVVANAWTIFFKTLIYRISQTWKSDLEKEDVDKGVSIIQSGKTNKKPHMVNNKMLGVVL